jgi:hypothetical protein
MRAPVLVRLAAAVVVATVSAACVPAPVGRITSTPEASAATSNLPVAGSSSTGVGPTGAPSFVRPSPMPSATFLVYEVAAGDSLTSIARLFGTTARSIAYWNRAHYPSLDPESSTYEPNRIETGWTLQLIPTEVVDEDELPDPTPTPTPPPSSPPPEASSGPS